MSKYQKNKKSRTAHVVSHVHWDREWRYPFWETQLMLCDFMEELIGILEAGKYPGLILDGQVVPIIDYLKIKPEMADRIKALVSNGKLAIGPWLLAPDHYPLDGECLVRNLLIGYRSANDLGGVTKVGYTSFGWGQTAQLPQIYAGFGIKIAMIGKLVSKKRAPNSEFIWRAPDGSELLTTRFGECGRANFYFKMHLTALFGINYEDPDWRYDWSKGGTAYHRADSEKMEQDHFRLDAPKTWSPDIVTPQLIEETWNTTNDSILDDDRLMMNGCDYTSPQPLVDEFLERINAVDAEQNRRWVHTTIQEFLKLMERKIDPSTLAVVHGELRDGPAGHLTGNALTTRIDLKRLNKKAQNMLIRFAEPLCAISAFAGSTYPTKLINKAWQFLLESQPHDSINGVTQDKTGHDVTCRLNQAIELSQALGDRAMQQLVQKIDLSGFNNEDVLLVVFNTSPFPRQEIAEAWVNMPAEESEQHNWPPEPQVIQIYDAKGSPVSTQWQGCSKEAYCVVEPHARAFPYYCKRHRVFFDTGKIPAGGYKVFVAKNANQKYPANIEGSDSQTRTSTLLKASNILENEYLIVEMNKDGSFNLTDKKLGQTFKNLNYYEDRGEHGDYWINKRPMFDKVYCSLGSPAKIWAEESGPLRASLISEIIMQIPKSGSHEQQKRGDELKDLNIQTRITLSAGKRQINVEVNFENQHEDHFLKVMLPTGIKKAKYADAGGHFIVDSRPIHPQGPTKNRTWIDMGTLPCNNFVDISDGQTGIAFINNCLTEYEVLDNDHRTVALSLIRSVRNWICTETRIGSNFPSQKGGQVLGHHTFSYSIHPHEGDWKNPNIPLTAQQFNTPLPIVQTRTHSTGTLPSKKASLFSIDNYMLRFSAIKKAQDRKSFIVRIYNPTDSIQKGKLTIGRQILKAWKTNLNEEKESEIKLKNSNTISLSLDPYKILTVEIKPKQNNKIIE